ncbi:hypothetical protein [Caulobacter phage Cr30]|uniref:hypothetical protein n=1 Tax=Caulobacter phage Cr30 TaxID=1357714 RepID=UPI0004A9B939|nr:hypothetical protein OZ74_gp118 [Caulobacter phage Cr30]AGS81003.1 hypothetical protein [Caulobacter phage Cr30]
MKIATWDIDGVIFLGEDLPGCTPRPNDFIITGRSFEEADETLEMLHERGIHNRVFFNPIPFHKKTRESSGIHKANTIIYLLRNGYDVVYHFEDDPIQEEIIEKMVPEIKVIRINHKNEIELENVRQGER